MPVEMINHVQLAMPAGEEAAARRFYADLLGIPEVDKPPNLSARGGCWFERGVLKVHLGVEPDFRPARKAHPAFTVSDLAALEHRLAAAGHEIVEDEPLIGFQRRYVSDPFGNRIELMEPVSS
jgi:catechol 2,3-dioxygenase-like lactoylglutathione lyase family enzyme